MSTNAPFYSQEFSQSHPPPPPQQFGAEEFKAPYDELIDDYAYNYSRNSNHATYALGVPISAQDQLRRNASQSLDSKPSPFDESISKHPDDNQVAARGYPPNLPMKEPGPRGLWEKVLPESLACRFYVITVLIQTTIDLAIEGSLLVQFHDAGSTSEKMPVYLSIFALAHVFQFIMAVDAVYARNTLQFLFLTVFNGLFLVYAIIQINEINEALPSLVVASSIPIHTLTVIIPIVIAVAEVAYIGLGWRIYNEFGWKVYKFIGADRQIKKMYANYQIFQCLVKFDVFFWVGFSVQFIWLVLENHGWEYYVTCAALPLSIIVLIEGHLAARHENKWMMATFMSGCVGALVYFTYKLIKVIVYRDDPQYSLVFKSLATFSIIAILLLLATFVFAVQVLRRFGNGLKESLEKKKSVGSQGQTVAPNPRRAASSNPYRMSID